MYGEWEKMDEPVGHLRADAESVPDRTVAYLIGHNYGGTRARTGIYRRQPDGQWHRVVVHAVDHHGDRNAIESSIADAIMFIRQNQGYGGRINLGIGCKGPTDTSTGWNTPGGDLTWERYNVPNHFKGRFPNDLHEVIAANDLMVDALGASVNPEVVAQIQRAIRRYHAAHPDAPISTDALHRNVAVVTLGTGAGFKFIDGHGKIGAGGEIWTLYAPFEVEFIPWLLRRIEEEKSTRDGQPQKYLLNTERFVSGIGLPIILEYLLATKSLEWREIDQKYLSQADDAAQAISELAHWENAAALMAFEHLAINLATLCQQIVQFHKPRAIILSGPSLITPNWDIMKVPFTKYFTRQFDEADKIPPLIKGSLIGLLDWMRSTPIAINDNIHSGIDGAALAANNIAFYK